MKNWIAGIIAAVVASVVTYLFQLYIDKPPEEKFRQVISPAGSDKPTFGKGSVAICDRGEFAVGGACKLTKASVNCGTSSRHIEPSSNSASGYECIVTHGCKDEVTAIAICAKR